MRRIYGAGPLHLVGHLALAGAAGWALWLAFTPAYTRGDPLNLALWLLAGALLHDLVFLPAYAVVDRVMRVVLPRGRRLRFVNHVRVPAVVAATMLLVYLPGILDRQPANVMRAAGRERPDLLGRWLLVTAVLFALSGLVLLVRVVRLQRAGAAAADEHRAVAADGD